MNFLSNINNYGQINFVAMIALAMLAPYQHTHQSRVTTYLLSALNMLLGVGILVMQTYR